MARNHNSQKAARFIALERGIVELKKADNFSSFSPASECPIKTASKALKTRKLPDLYAPVYAPTTAVRPSLVMNNTLSIDEEEVDYRHANKIIGGKVGMRNPVQLSRKEIYSRRNEEFGNMLSRLRPTSRRWSRLNETKRASVKPAELLLRAYEAEMAGPDAFIETVAAFEASMETYRDDDASLRAAA
ncbi:MAG: hypothetical protein ACLQF0_05660 [Dissulfurispiraceae bacterium]